MSWITKINSLYQDQPVSVGWRRRPDYRSPASCGALQSVEAEFSCQIPQTLRSLLAESNGVMNMMSVDEGEWFDEGWLIWSIEEIAQQNRWLRSSYRDRELERYLFFSSPGADGIMFGCPLTLAVAPDLSVFAWYPDQTPDRHLCDGLELILQRTIAGRLSV